MHAQLLELGSAALHSMGGGTSPISSCTHLYGCMVSIIYSIVCYNDHLLHVPIYFLSHDKFGQLLCCRTKKNPNHLVIAVANPLPTCILW